MIKGSTEIKSGVGKPLIEEIQRILDLEKLHLGRDHPYQPNRYGQVSHHQTLNLQTAAHINCFATAHISFRAEHTANWNCNQHHET